jgi:ADP-heptose:LPS heptosyltransferase
VKRYTQLAREITIRAGRGILLVDSQGLGDVVQSLPLLRAICRWAEGRWPMRALFATADHYEIVSEERLNLIPFFVSSVPRKAASVLRLWRELVGRSDLIVCAPEMSGLKLVGLKYAIGSRHAIGEASKFCNYFLTAAIEASWTRPWTETQDEIAASLGVETPLEPPSIHLSQSETARARSVLNQAGVDETACILGVQCSSVVPQKSWPAENFGEVIREMRKRHAKLRVVSFGNKEELRSAQMARRAAGNVSWLEGAGRWTIRETLAMLSCCDLFLSGDTGLMHMAAALGTPTVSIFGPTSAERRAPTHNHGITICPLRACYPCFRGAWTPCDCIQSIAPERVIAVVHERLSQLAAGRDAMTKELGPQMAPAGKV